MVQSIKAALTVAHDELGNRAAISVKNMADAGVTLTDNAVNQWVAYVDELRASAINYIKASHDPETTDRQISTLQGKVWSEWRKVIKQGTEKDFNAKFFVRKGDVTHICGLCGEKFQNSAKGKQVAAVGATEFRRNIETLIGVRMAGNGLLEDEDRDTLSNYENAVKKIKTTTDVLNGYTRGKDTEIGLYARLKLAEAKLSKYSEKVANFDLSDDDKKELLADYTNPVESLKKQIKQAETDLDKAKQIKDETEGKYELLMGRLSYAGLDA